MSHEGQSLNLFEKTITSLIKKRTDSRKLTILNLNKPGKFFHFVSKSEKFCFQCAYSEKLIEIYYDLDQIKKKYITSITSDDELNNVFSYLAFHEYGHSLFCESTEILKQYWENNERIQRVLKQYNWFVIARAFGEYFADYKAKKMGMGEPKEFLQECANWVKNSNLNHYYVMLLPQSKYNLNDRMREDWFSGTLENLRRFNIWNKWDDINDILKDTKVSATLEVLRMIFNFFDFLCKQHKDQIKTRDKLLNFFQVIDKINFDSILFENKITTDIINKINYYLEKRRKNEGESTRRGIKN